MRSPTPTDTRLTSRQERFCQAFVVYATAATAAIEAGYARSNARQYGSRLLKTERIRARIRAIQSGLAADHGRDMDVLLGKLEIVYRRAIEDHHFTAAGRAVEMQARLGRMSKIPALSLSGPPKERGPSPPVDLSPSGPPKERGPSPPVDLSLSGPPKERGPSPPVDLSLSGPPKERGPSSPVAQSPSEVKEARCRQKPAKADIAVGFSIIPARPDPAKTAAPREHIAAFCRKLADLRRQTSLKALNQLSPARGYSWHGVCLLKY